MQDNPYLTGRHKLSPIERQLFIGPGLHIKAASTRDVLPSCLSFAYLAWLGNADWNARGREMGKDSRAVFLARCNHRRQKNQVCYNTTTRKRRIYVESKYI